MDVRPSACRASSASVTRAGTPGSDDAQSSLDPCSGQHSRWVRRGSAFRQGDSGASRRLGHGCHPLPPCGQEGARSAGLQDPARTGDAECRRRISLPPTTSKRRISLIALKEYRALEYDLSNRIASAKAADLERKIRDRVEAARPKPKIDELREKARQLGRSQS